MKVSVNAIPHHMGGKWIVMIMKNITYGGVNNKNIEDLGRVPGRKLRNVLE